MSSTLGKGTKVKIELEKRNYKPGKFKKMVDPTVVNAPFTLIVDEDKCMGCGVCLRNCPCSTIDMVPKNRYSEMQAPACQFNCPAGTDIREYMKLLNDGAYSPGIILFPQLPAGSALIPAKPPVTEPTLTEPPSTSIVLNERWVISVWKKD
ncbi:MAG: hypothetical protein CVU55_00070 [Deltaproteobacteria bacterium HGW-Deltaproteobacteria-13]|nr:MAG: hypothetical protein CVU55_00070 [Deltaproteobacteria bacterium HGW-Deltaproteobacteria-13]